MSRNTCTGLRLTFFVIQAGLFNMNICHLLGTCFGKIGNDSCHETIVPPFYYCTCIPISDCVKPYWRTLQKPNLIWYLSLVNTKKLLMLHCLFICWWNCSLCDIIINYMELFPHTDAQYVPCHYKAPYNTPLRSRLYPKASVQPCQRGQKVDLIVASVQPSERLAHSKPH